MRLPDKADSDDYSDNSEWSELENPGSSKLDKLIDKRNRFNLHYHKGDIITIPETNRIPLLPNEEAFDWIEERKLMAIQRSYPAFRAKRKRTERREYQIKDPLLNSLKDEWAKLTDTEKQSIRKRQSIAFLENAFADDEEQPDCTLSPLPIQQILASRGRGNWRGKARPRKFFNDSKSVKKKSADNKNKKQFESVFQALSQADQFFYFDHKQIKQDIPQDSGHKGTKQNPTKHKRND